jgi:hypothetical protein
MMAFFFAPSLSRPSKVDDRVLVNRVIVPSGANHDRNRQYPRNDYRSFGRSRAGGPVTITCSATGQISTVTTTSTGAYSSGALIPGSYLVRVESPGFKTAELQLEVEVGVTSAANIVLQVGAVDEVITVSSLVSHK